MKLYYLYVRNLFNKTKEKNVTSKHSKMGHKRTLTVSL